jgi:hypothetical protein
VFCSLGGGSAAIKNWRQVREGKSFSCTLFHSQYFTRLYNVFHCFAVDIWAFRPKVFWSSLLCFRGQGRAGRSQLLTLSRQLSALVSWHISAQRSTRRTTTTLEPQPPTFIHRAVLGRILSLAMSRHNKRAASPTRANPAGKKPTVQPTIGHAFHKLRQHQLRPQKQDHQHDTGQSFPSWLFVHGLRMT